MSSHGCRASSPGKIMCLPAPRHTRPRK
uniref:Uncharacterized protein n=1 Tax=Lepeophtheirus salmonis TaxID=72036 RepID=A0A0K2TS80_LEPSM